MLPYVYVHVYTLFTTFPTFYAFTHLDDLIHLTFSRSTTLFTLHLPFVLTPLDSLIVTFTIYWLRWFICVPRSRYLRSGRFPAIFYSLIYLFDSGSRSVGGCSLPFIWWCVRWTRTFTVPALHALYTVAATHATAHPHVTGYPLRTVIRYRYRGDCHCLTHGL